jgi:hypothetical protein
VGYCAQFDTYPKGLTGYQFIYSFLRVFGMSHEECDRRTMAALEGVGLSGARNRQVAAYSKGMRQRVKLAQATAHEPQVVILDEPLNGLDPMIPAAVVMVWENLNPFLPSVLKKISVIFYLKNLCPVEIPIPPPFNVMVIDADPTPFWIAVPGLLALSLILLVYSGLSARHTEISYGE